LLELVDGSLCVSDRFAQRYGKLEDPESVPDPPNWNSPEGVTRRDLRSSTETDRGKIYYSHFYRRLAGVTQVLSPEPSRPRMHSRLVHSQKVSLVAREIGETVCRAARGAGGEAMRVREALVANGGFDIVAAEVAGLCHDFGHPPFGHSAERVLDEELRNPHLVPDLVGGDAVEDGFEGNAQTFRILTLLDLRNDVFHGLGLTNVTLAAVQKYPRSRRALYPTELEPESWAQTYKGGDKFGAYAHGEPDEAARVATNRLVTGDVEGRGLSIEAAAMDLADDITYAIHDFEDFYAENLLQGGRLRTSLVDAIDRIDEAAKTHKLAPNWREWDKDQSWGEVVASANCGSYNPILESAAELFRKSVPGSPVCLAHYREALQDVKERVVDALSFDFTKSDYDVARLKMALSGLVKDYFSALRFGYANELPVTLEPEVWHSMQVLKSFARGFVLSSPGVGLSERSEARAIQITFRGLERWVFEADKAKFGQLPEPLESYLPPKGELRMRPKSPRAGALPSLTGATRRAIADYLCSLTDVQCRSMARWMAGVDTPGVGALI
jgi:dGTPase